jgi:hypothetical protein
MRSVRTLLAGLLLGIIASAPGVEPAAWTPPVSTWVAGESEPWEPGQAQARLLVRIRHDGRPRPARVIVTAADGSHPDGSGNGTYGDGRFFVDGEFTVVTVPGRARVEIRSGPDHVPLTADIDLSPGRQVTATAELARWYSPQAEGWYGGDNHVHAQHDATEALRTGLPYTALQGRANGLAYVTEAGSAAAVSYDNLERLSTPEFLLRVAGEIRPGPFLGHFNPAGLREAIPPGRIEELTRAVMPHHRLAAEVRQRGGVMIQTHPTTPPHQLHWMGSSMFLADAVLGTTPQALDQDHPSTQALWFLALNLGNRVAASGSTDAALGRRNAPSPGDRRVYSHGDRFTYEAIIDGIRRGRTVATNGGALFLTMTVDGRLPGDEVVVDVASRPLATVAVHALNPLRRVVLYVNGTERWSGEVAGRRGHLTLEIPVPLPADLAGWCVARAESQGGEWAVTSPVYLRPASAPTPPPATFTLLQISNATRYASLSPQFFAHLIATVRPPEEITVAELLHDGAVLRRFVPGEGDQRHEDRVAVTQPFGAYGPGWAWHRVNAGVVHFQADWPVTATGWYALRLHTTAGRRVESDAVRFDQAEPLSHQLGVAQASDGRSSLTWWAFGMEAPLADLPEGDHWWYPQKTFWRMTTSFGGITAEIGGGDRAAAARFRSVVP